MTTHVSHANHVLQDPEQRPRITEVKDALLEYARLHFKSTSPAEAMAMKHMKERALLDQILPPKVCAACVLGMLSKSVPFIPTQSVLSMTDALTASTSVFTSFCTHTAMTQRVTSIAAWDNLFNVDRTSRACNVSDQATWCTAYHSGCPTSP